MSIVRTLLHLLLSLALVAGGVLPDVAQAMHEHGGPAMAVAAENPPPCHASAPRPVEPAAPDLAGCCDDGACACDCLHHAPVAMVLVPRLLALPIGRWMPAWAERPSPSPAPLPSLRPPIA